MRGSVDHEVWTMRWGIKDNPHSNFSPTSTSLPKSPHPLSSKQKLHEDLFLHQPLCPATPNFNNFNQSPLYFTPPHSVVTTIRYCYSTLILSVLSHSVKLQARPKGVFHLPADPTRSTPDLLDIGEYYLHRNCMQNYLCYGQCPLLLACRCHKCSDTILGTLN